MHAYSYCDITIQSEIELRDLSQAGDIDPDVTFRVGRADYPLALDSAWQQLLSGENNGISYAVKMETDLHRLSFDHVATFEIGNEFSEITCHPEPATSLNSVRHLLLDQVLPRILAAQGKSMLHGSCVAHPKGAIIFAGPAGTGKSTLAAHFSQHGLPLLTDDGLQLKQEAGRIMVIPTYPGLRLWDDSIAELAIEPGSLEPLAHYTSKKRILFHSAADLHEQPALCLLFINPQQTDGLPSIHRIVNLEAFLALNKQLFILNPFSGEESISRIQFTAELINHLPVADLTFPHDYSMLDSVRKSVLKWVEVL